MKWFFNIFKKKPESIKERDVSKFGPKVDNVYDMLTESQYMRSYSMHIDYMKFTEFTDWCEKLKVENGSIHELEVFWYGIMFGYLKHKRSPYNNYRARIINYVCDKKDLKVKRDERDNKLEQLGILLDD